MALLLRISLLYFLFATVALMLLGEDLSFVAIKLLFSMMQVRNVFTNLIIWPIVLMSLAILWGLSKPEDHFARRLGRGMLALILCCIFLSAYSTVKTAMPEAALKLGLAPFFAVPFFADLDVLLFGTDPWQLAHDLTQTFTATNFASQANVVYGIFWVVPALYLPAVLITFGDREDRIRHFVLLYAFTWIGLGNVVAFAGLSGGPIFYDRVFGTERFAELHAALEFGGFSSSWFGNIQANLWNSYDRSMNMLGSGISAFPSVHVGAAFVTALYLNERHWALGICGWLFTASILFISVWIGFHYLLDGVFSILAILILHMVLKRRAAASSETFGVHPVAAE